MTLGTTTVTTTTTSTANKKAKKGAGKAAKAARKGAGSRGGQVERRSTPTDMTVVASPNPYVETSGSNGNKAVLRGHPQHRQSPTWTAGTSGPLPVTGNNFCFGNEIYTITVTNSGTTTVNPVLVTDDFSTNSDFTSDTYTSVAAGGASGNSQGSGPGFQRHQRQFGPPAGVVGHLTKSTPNSAAECTRTAAAATRPP